MKKLRRILVSRTDRLGDVLMSLQSLRTLRLALPETEIDFLVRSDLFPVLAGFAKEMRLNLVEWKPSFALEQAYDGALCLFDEPELLLQFKSRKVRIRVGNYSKLRSFLKLTHGLRQRRALGEKNEGEYNLNLARLFLSVVGATAKPELAPILLPTMDTGLVEATKALARVGITHGEPYWIAHPGMGGSALNLSASAYVKLLGEMERTQEGTLILTLGPAPADFKLVDAIVDSREDWRVLPRVSLSALAEVFRTAKRVVAPSTGPLHLAHYVGASTLGIYSPVRSHQPRRWEPWGGTGESAILAPAVLCPGKRDCLGKRCPHYYCLDGMTAARLPSTLEGALKVS